MEPKTIREVCLGVVAVAALAVAVGKTSTVEITAGKETADVAAASAMTTQPGVGERTCYKEWVNRGRGPVIGVLCDTPNGPTAMNEDNEAEMLKLLGDDGMAVKFVPRETEKGIALDALVQPGVMRERPAQ